MKQLVRRTVGEPYVGKRLKLRRLNAVLPALRLDPTEILDAGAEDATFVYWLADRYRRAGVTAIDINQAAIAHCLAARPLSYADRVQFLAGSFSQLESGRYQLITVFDVLEHIQDDAAALAELCRALAPGGTLLVHVPRNVWTDAQGVAHHIADADAAKINEGHVRQGYSPERLAELVSQAGLSIKDQQVWLGHWAVVAHDLYRRLEHPAPLRLLSIPLTDTCSWLERRQGDANGNSVFLRATKPA